MIINVTYSNEWFTIKKGLWRENYKDIKQVKDELEKVRDIPMPQKKIERNYLAKQTIANARIWFRYRAKIIDNIKGNKSSLWTGRMQCRHCNTRACHIFPNLEF